MSQGQVQMTIELTPPEGHEPYVEITGVNINEVALIQDPPLIIQVDMTMNNFIQRGGPALIENDYGRMLYAGYPRAYTLARRYFGFENVLGFFEL